MRRKDVEREQAIRLRRNGATLREIVAALGVSKSIASLWVQNIEMTTEGAALYANKMEKFKERTKELLCEYRKRSHERAIANPCKSSTREYHGCRRAKKNVCLCCGKPCVNKFCCRKCDQQYKKRERKKHLEERIKSGDYVYIRCLKAYLFEMRGHKCEICNLAEWFGKPMNLVLDHIDGDSKNDKLDNVRLICNNCDSYLPTYKSRNKGSKRTWRKVVAKNDHPVCDIIDA